MYRSIILSVGLIASGTALAQVGGAMALTTFMKVERTEVDAKGVKRIVLAEPNGVTPGDTLLFAVSYRNGGAKPVNGLVLNNPVPKQIRYVESKDADALVSVDGGKNFGQLAALKVAAADGSARAALPEDVTNVRWVLTQTIAPGQQGGRSFRGTIR